MHKEGIPALEISLERGTPTVPDDGQWHIRFRAEVVSSHVREATAREQYRRLRDLLVEETGYETGYKPPGREELLRRLSVERDLNELRAQAARSKRAKATRRGGKGGSGGVGG